MKARVLWGLIVASTLAAWACGGGGGYSAAPTAPSPTAGAAGSAGASSVIGIVANSGAQSFNPNPADAAQGATVAWKNNDAVTHRIVMNDGSLDTGLIGPGQTSAALAMATNGGNYHCAIHPSMVGSIKASTGVPPACQGLYC